MRNCPFCMLFHFSCDSFWLLASLLQRWIADLLFCFFFVLSIFFFSLFLLLFFISIFFFCFFWLFRLFRFIWCFCVFFFFFIFCLFFWSQGTFGCLFIGLCFNGSCGWLCDFSFLINFYFFFDFDLFDDFFFDSESIFGEKVLNDAVVIKTEDLAGVVGISIFEKICTYSLFFYLRQVQPQSRTRPTL